MSDFKRMKAAAAKISMIERLKGPTGGHKGKYKYLPKLTSFMFGLLY
jgi:hypothetical protein